MSYILDALKKSEQERDREPVYEINQPIRPVADATTTRKRWLWLIPALLAVNILLLLWPETTPDTDSSSVRIIDPMPSVPDNLSSTLTKTENLITESARDTKVENITPSSNDLAPALPSLNPTKTQTTANPVDRTQRYHRNPFAPMPGRIEPEQVALAAPIKHKTKPTQVIPSPNIEKLNRSLLNQALIEQLAPLRDEQSVLPSDTLSFPAARNASLINKNISQTAMPEPKDTPQYESAPTTVDNQKHIPLLRELSSTLQRDIPALNVSVHIYTDIPEQRMARINGTMTRQGQQLSNELILEEIRPDSLIFSFRGETFRLMR